MFAIPEYEEELEKDEQKKNLLNQSKYLPEVIVSITTHGCIKLVKNSHLPIESSRYTGIERFKFKEKIEDSKIILVNTAPIGSINFTTSSTLEICNTTLLEGFNKHITTKKTKETKNILESITSVITNLCEKVLRRQSPVPAQNPTSSQSPTTTFVEEYLIYLQELDRRANFDVFKELFDRNYTSKNIEITIDNIREELSKKQKSGKIGKNVDIEQLAKSEYYKKLYIDWFEETYGVQVIKNGDSVIEKYYSASVYERKNKPEHDYNIQVLNSSSKSLITDLNIQPVQENPEKKYSDITKEDKETYYSTKLSDIINHLNSNGAKKIIIFDFTCAVISENNTQVEDQMKILCIRRKEEKKYENNKTQTQKRKRESTKENEPKNAKRKVIGQLKTEIPTNYSVKYKRRAKKLNRVVRRNNVTRKIIRNKSLNDLSKQTKSNRIMFNHSAH
jgi:hypothetical protein